MNKLFLVLIGAMMFFSCMREDNRVVLSTSRGGVNNNFYHTCADSWNETIPSQGLAGEVDVLKLRLGKANIKSWWIAFYGDLPDGDRIWVQWGYAVDKGGLFQAFFVYKFHNGSGFQFVPPIVNSNTNVPLTYNTRVRFEIKNVGSTWWALSRNGLEVLRVDLGISQSLGVFQACTESWGDQSFSPSLNTYYLETLKEGQWTKIKTGVANGKAWGIQGNEQNKSLINSQVIMGGSLPIPNDPAWLWGKPN